MAKPRPVGAIDSSVTHGFLFLHGKKSGPAYSACSLHPLVKQTAEHSLVDFVSHAWAFDRLYDQSFEASLESIQAARQRLADQGAEQIHIVGHSLGGNAALYYATKYQDFDSLILLAPAHNTHIGKIKAQCSWSVRKAKDLLAQGLTGPDYFVDFDSADVTVSCLRPEIYISYFDSDGPCNMTVNAKKIPRPISVLCLSGSQDVTQTTTRELVYNQIPKTDRSKFYLLDEDHYTVCYNTHDLIYTWINGL